MIGAIIITHGSLAASLLEAAELISGKVENVKTVAVKSSDATDNVRNLITSAVKEVNRGQGVVIFTDMFGGTPTNMALSVLEVGKVEVITGVNLPIILKFINHRGEKTLQELVPLLKEYGQKSIVLAGDMLKESK
jgi:mannose PTS system EIIA component